MTPDAAMEALAAAGDAGRAAGMAAYHKAARPCLGTPNPVINDLTRSWRRALTVPERLALARGLWATNVHEARIAAAKVLTQARIAGDGEVWDFIAGCVPEFDAWAIADHMSSAGERRLVADPRRLDAVEGWVGSPHLWTRRAALVMTLPWGKQNHPTAAELAARERVLGWCAALVPDRELFIQKAIAWWLRDLSKHDPARVREFLDRHGAGLKPFARKEAGRLLG
jgi:3-methyladenine DNA glycosylase AlkD